MQSEYEKSDRKKIDLKIRWSKSSGLAQNPTTLGHQIFKSKKDMISKFKMLSTPTASSSSTVDKLDGDTQLYNDVASHPMRGRCVSPWPDYNRLARARA